MEAKPRKDPAIRITAVSVDFKVRLAVYLSLIVGAGGILFDFQSTPAELIAVGKDGEAVRGWKSGGKLPHSQIKLIVNNNWHAPHFFVSVASKGLKHSVSLFRINTCEMSRKC